jgi:hypothetical protein
MTTRTDTTVADNVAALPGTPVVGVPMPCRGQLVHLPPGEYDWLHLRLDGGEPGAEVTLWLHYADGVDPEPLCLPPLGTPARVGVPRHDTLHAVRVPDQPDLRLLALTAAPARNSTREGR